MKKIATLLLSLAASCSMFAANKVVGDYGGSMSVSPTGAATYTVPIECPKGVNGMEPNVALVYNSQSGIGSAGMGWNLSATSVIAKANAVPFYDNKLLPLNYDGSGDYLKLDGQRLIKVKTISSTEAEFRTENDNYNRIIRKGSNGNFYFEVYTPSGLMMTYRHQPSNLPTSFPCTGYWYLTEVVDQNGNYMTYDYKTEVKSDYYKGYYCDHVYLSSISYGASKSNPTHSVKIVFSYTVITPYKYVIEGYDKQIDCVLNKIQTYAGTNLNTLNSEYVLTHTTDAFGNKFLNKVVKYGNNGDYLGDLKIDWNSFADNAWATTEKSYGVSNLGFNNTTPDKKLWYPLDYNDDGYTDLIAVYEYTNSYTIGGTTYSDTYTVFDYYKNDKGTIKFDRTKPCGGTILDYSMTKDGFVSNSGLGAFQCHLCSRSESIPIILVADFNSSIAVRDANNPNSGFRIRANETKMPAHTVADINNDGYDDIIIASTVVKNGKANIVICYGGQSSTLSGYVSLSNSLVPYTTSGTPERVAVNDMDGDGLLDIVVVASTGYNVLKNNGFTSSNKCEFTEKGYKSDMRVFPVSTSSPFFVSGDFNGDGIIDFCTLKDKNLTFYNGTKNFSFSPSTEEALSYPVFNYANMKNKRVMTADLNGDGITDLLFLNDNSNYGAQIVYGSRGGRKSTYIQSANVASGKIGQFLLGDFCGEGKTQVLSIGQSLKTKTKNNDYIFINKDYSSPYMNLVKSIVAPTRTFTINYSNLYDTGVYSKTIGESSNLISLKLPLNVVKTITEDKFGQSMSMKNYYRYENLICQTTGKGVLGFKMTEVENFNYTTDIVTKTYNSIDYTNALLYPSYTDVQTFWGDPISRESYTYSKSTFGTNSKGVRLQLTKKETMDRLNNTTCTTTYAYSSNSNGNPTTITVDKGDNVKSKTVFSDLVSNSTYNVFLPQTKVETLSNASGSISRTSKYTYDSKLQLTKSIDFYNTDKALTTTYAYTGKGNLSQEKITASGCETKTTSYDYEGTGRFRNKVATSDGVTTIYGWNAALGRIIKKTESVGSLSYVTTYDSFDGFNNCLKSTLPDGRVSTKAISYVSTFPPCFYRVKTTLTGSSDMIEVYDSDGRKIRTTTAYADGVIRSDFKNYDNAGFLLYDYFPIIGDGTPSGNKYYVRNTYDDFGRIEKEERPGGTTTYTYAPLKTTIKSPLGTKVLEYNKAGQLIKSTENGMTVTFTYEPGGQIASSTAQSSGGNLTTTMSYDIAGNRISITDPDVGTIQNKYDAYGREIYMKTETNREINSKYDSRGRLTSVQDGFDNAGYTYNDNNQLVKESCNSYNCTYTYDGFNRVTSKLEKEAGMEFKTQYAYPNNYDGVSKITFPSGVVVNNTYNKGYLSSVTCAGKTIWSGFKLDTYGRPSEETLAGSVVKKYGYNGKEQLSKETAYKGSTGLMDLSYTYTGVNITKKTDALGGNAEQYTYDNLNRLSGVTTTHSSSTLNGTTTYDGLGNMKTTWDNYCTMTYGDNSAPHRVSKATYSNASVPTGLPKAKFDSYRMPTRIEQGDYALDIEYRPDHRRSRTKSYKSGTITCRKYFLTDYEKEVHTNGTNREIHYLYGGNGLAAIYTRTAGKDTLFAAVTDRQNSLTAVMDVATNKVEKFAYKPWGMRRNPANWAAEVVNDYPARFSRGYCMHEHLSNLGLINMGGRVYNARTNQFISPDPYRQAPDSWLNCNRFGYCMNNPVMYTDPDGELIWIPILIAAGVSAAVNVGIKAYNGQLHSAGDVAKALGWGALAGGVGGFIGVTAAPILAGGGFFAGFVTGTVCAFESTLIQSLGNHLSFGDPMISNAALAFNSLIGGFTCGIGNGIMAKISGRNFWSGRPQQYCGPDMDMLPQKIVTEKQLADEAKPNFVADEGGNCSVYRGVDPKTGEVKYIGITERDPQVRWAEHLNSNTPRADLRFELVPDVPRGISRINGKIWEQTLINQYGGPRNVLYNQINSIAPKYWNQYNIPPVSPDVPPASIHFIIKTW